MQNLGYYNGVYAPLEELMIPALDRAVYFGDGVYEYVYCRNKKIFALHEHLKRLFVSMELIRITPPMSAEEMEQVILEGLKQVDGNEHGVYFQISRGTYYRKHFFPPVEKKANFLMFIVPTELRDVNKPFHMCTMEDIRWQCCNIKSLNLIPNVLAAQHAVEENCTETIFHRGETVTENATSNLFIVKDGTLITAPLSNQLLAGVTREHVLALAREMNIPTLEKSFTLSEMFSADEVIMASTSTHCASVSTIDGKEVGGKAEEIVRKLRNAYRDKVLGETSAE